MTAIVVDWKRVIAAGVETEYGLAVTVENAPPTTTLVGECDCPDGHLWIALAQPCPCAGQP